MKRKTKQLLSWAVPATIAVMASLSFWTHTPAPTTDETTKLDAPEKEAELPRPLPPPDRSTAQETAAPAASPEPRRRPASPPPPKPSATTRQQERYLDQRAQLFLNQQERLDAETDPDKRHQLIRRMANHVRVDTLSTLDWAMTIEDPEEQRAALEAINDRALVGIGAQISQDENGLPRITDTTLLSAAAATGRVRAGDHIAGMINENGTYIDFMDRPLPQIIQNLRGKAGTDITLLMQDPETGEIFEVPIIRSMIVLPPR